MSSPTIRKQIREMKEGRIQAARDAIEKAGGAAALARALSHHRGRTVTTARVKKWRYVGIPAEWGPLVELLVKGVSRETLNPWVYIKDPQVMHSREVINTVISQ